MELEERIVDLVAAVLGKDRADLERSFPGGLVDLGCTSLQAVQLNRILEEEFDREINILDLVDAKGVAEISALILADTVDHSGLNPRSV